MTLSDHPSRRLSTDLKLPTNYGRPTLCRATPGQPCYRPGEGDNEGRLKLGLRLLVCGLQIAELLFGPTYILQKLPQFLDSP